MLRIIFMPQGVVGALQGLKLKRTPRAAFIRYSVWLVL
jgi:hypothetical protein